MNTTVLSDNNDGGIIANFGTFSFTGAANSNTRADMAFLNDNNATFDTGTFNFGHTSSATNGYAYKMDSGTTTLRHGITVDLAGNGYYQTGGTLSSPDNTSTELFMNANYGKAEIDGGIVALGSAPGAAGQPVYGTLNIFGSAGVIDLAFNGGEFDAKIDGQAGGDNHEDRINVFLGNVTIGGNSTLKVTAVNLQPGQNVVPGQSWDIITRATKITGDWNSAFSLCSGELGIQSSGHDSLEGGCYNFSDDRLGFLFLEPSHIDFRDLSGSLPTL
jgi:hypothetical protein